MSEKDIELFKALSDATRQDILEFLSGMEECHVNEICGAFESLSQPTISHHLQVLKRVNLVTSDRRGKLTYYSMRKANLRDHIEIFISRFDM